MATETLNISVVETGDGTNRLVQACNNLADSADRVAGATDRSTASSRTASTAREQEAASTTKAATAVKGYVDANGNYIRAVGSNANITQASVNAQSALRGAISANTIEAGRAAAGYAPLNAAVTSAGSYSQAFNARIGELNRALSGTAAPAQAAAAGTAAIAPAVNQAGQAAQTANGWIAQYRQSLYGVAPAGQAAAGGAGAAGGGAAGATPHFQGLGSALSGVGSAARGLAGPLGAIAGALTVGAVIKYSDGWNSVQNKLRLVTTDQTKLNEIMNTAMGIAQRTYTPFEAIATLYGKIAQSAGAYRLSAKDVADVTTSLALSFQVSGASGVEAGRAIEQFTQGLSKGKLELQDFKSLVQASPAVTNALTLGLRNMGVAVTGGLGPALTSGTISVKQMLDAFIGVKPILEAFAAGSVPTVAQSITYLENSFQAFIGRSNEAQGAMRYLSAGIVALGNNMQILVPVALGLGAVLSFGMIAGAVTAIATLTGAIATLAVTIVTGAIGAITALGAAIVANPLLAGTLAAAALAAGAAIYIFRDSLTAAASSALGLSGTGTIVEQVMAKAKAAGDSLRDVMDKAATSTTKAGHSAQQAGEYYNAFGQKLQSFSEIQRNWNAQAEATRQRIDAITEANKRWTAEIDAANQAVVNAGAGLGLFVGQLENVNMRLSQGQSALASMASGLDNVASSYNNASAAAENFGARSNTVNGQIGGGTATGISAQEDPYGDARFWGYGQQGTFTTAQITAMRQSAYNAYQIKKAVEQARLQDSINDAVAGRNNPVTSSAGSFNQGLIGFATGGAFTVGNDNVPHNVARFANGGFMVGGSGSTDSQLVQFMASPNERVTIETPSQVMGGKTQPTVTRTQERRTMIANIVVKADDYGQFKRSQRQIAQDMGTRIARG